MRLGSDDRPLDRICGGKRITYYRNYAGNWMPCPATEENCNTLANGYYVLGRIYRTAARYQIRVR